MHQEERTKEKLFKASSVPLIMVVFMDQKKYYSFHECSIIASCCNNHYNIALT